MKTKTTKIKLFGFIAAFAIITIGSVALSLSLTSCDNGSGDPELSGTITISPTSATVGDKLTATYSGMEAVAYQWKQGTANVGTDSNEYTPTAAGSYTVTVSADGFKPKTSAAVTVSPADPNRVAIPTANPPAGAVTSGTTVTLSTTTAGADIWYTTGNSAPAKNGTGSVKYASPIAITAAVTIKAIAVKDGMTDSNVLTAAYTISSGGNPIKSVSVGAQSGTLTAGTAGNATFTVTTANINSGTAITLNNTNTVAGITLGTTATSGNSTNVSINTTTATPQGSHPLTLTIDGTTSNAFNLAVSAGSGGTTPEITISTQPQAATVTEGSITESLTVAASVSEGGTPAYQWYSNTSGSTTGGNIVSGETSASFAIPTTLTAGTYYYFCEVSATGAESVRSNVATVTVTINIPNPFTSIPALNSWLESAPANTAANPFPLKLEIDLGDMTSAADNWQKLLGVLNTAGKYVELDLSDCEMTGTEFNPVGSVSTGKDKIVAITLPEAGETITAGNALYSTFDNFDNLASVTIPNGYTAIPYNAFGGCRSLTSIDIPNSVESIGQYAFGNCTGLTSVTIPDSVESISYLAFQSCTGLTSVTIGNSVESIGNRAFAGCTSLTSIDIPDSVISIGGDISSTDGAFNGCTSLTSVTIGTGVTSIPDSMFRGCTSLTSVDIPDSVESIGSYAFNGCTRLTSVDIPDSVESIGSYAFNGCTGLTSVIIPDNVTRIGGYAFNGCTRLESITIPFVGNTLNGTTNTHFGWIFGGGTDYNTPNPQNNAIPASLKEVIITGGNIDTRAFAQCTGLTSVTIGDGVTSIGQQAFNSCTGLTSVTIPTSVTIGNNAFGGCTSLTDISGILAGRTSIGDSWFYSCTGLTSVTIGDSVESIGGSAFLNCDGLTSVTFERADTSFISTGSTSSYSFLNAPGLKTAYTEGGIGTYTRRGSSLTGYTWTKQD